MDGFKKKINIVIDLAKMDFKSRYLGSSIGSFWAFIFPLINLAIMWFAFHFGLKTPSVQGVPFILWIITGLFPWSFFTDAITSSMNSVIDKAFLVKKVVFPVELLPLIKIFASLIIFVFLNIIMILVFLFNGSVPNLAWLQVFYFGFCLTALVLSLAWLTSSVVVFYRDLGHVITIIVQLGFWASPVFWSGDNLPEKYWFILFFNPVAYVINGYRAAFFREEWFWTKPYEAIFFWGLVCLFTFIGYWLFRKLRPHFADVL